MNGVKREIFFGIVLVVVFCNGGKFYFIGFWFWNFFFYGRGICCGIIIKSLFMVEGWCVGRVVGISSEIKCVGCIGNYSFGLYEWDLFYV